MDVFIGSLLLVPFNYAPQGFVPCDGRLLNIRQNSALYSLLGIMYGGDGVNTFAVPDLRGTVPVGQGQRDGAAAYEVGKGGGANTVRLTNSNTPPHTHSLNAANVPANQTTPSGIALAKGAMGVNYYTGGNPSPILMAPRAINSAGSTQEHDNMGPSLTLMWVIATQGIFPSRD